ncbi:patatin-domain-containing protein [Westerdykella ornata]|uniref:Patatin-like phospholipase domain-containing protein n=1 Tax=Westerdykella ornata TaxID=318751 RepID=A0A6A6JEI9_WESOR|nr:patatin-domain-containing protein [Westerdykella ornata]KAF2275030.1 patatin-domain-containing protein [Westerdykella ornata]
MSFLSDTVLPGTGRLPLERPSKGKSGRTSLRKSRSHASFVASLVRFARDPAANLEGFATNTAHDPIQVDAKRAVKAAEEDRKQIWYLRLRNAETYEEFRSAATALDTLEGNDVWKCDDASDEYNATLVAARLKQLEEARISCDVTKMLFLIRTSLTRDLGGMGDLRLYKHSHIGTKRLIERYIESAQNLLAALLDVSAKQGASCPVKTNILVEQLLLARQSFGRSALLLSGGGTLGMNHIGVVKSLWEQRLLPRIVSGASAGSIVCAVLCSKTDEEIPKVLEEFCHGDLAVFEKEGEEEGLMKRITRFLKYGALFDISLLGSVLRNLLGDITFLESYNRTRRILNITVSSASLYELPRLLNYITAPNVMIWSAVCASCSVPFIFSAASLLAKDPRTGKEVPWNQTPNASWIDGSVDNDLPMTRLAEMFNVNHFIVSQVNPHVVPFLAREEDTIAADAQQQAAVSATSTWIHDLANLAKEEASHRLQFLSELGIFPNYLTKIRSVINQRYSGDITIFPSISYSQFPKVLSNPTPEFMQQCLLTGERATWSKLSRIQNHLAIELALDDTLRQLRARAVFSAEEPHVRFHDPTRPRSHHGENSRLSSRHRPSTSLTTTGLPHSLHPPSPIKKHQLVRLPSSHVVRPSQSLEFARTDAPPIPTQTISASPNGNGTSSVKMPAESDISLSPPGSSLPNLWPNNGPLFPFASQPTTPGPPPSHVVHQNSSFPP